jgi:hypothetical protein
MTLRRDLQKLLLCFLDEALYDRPVLFTEFL